MTIKACSVNATLEIIYSKINIYSRFTLSLVIPTLISFVLLNTKGRYFEECWTLAAIVEKNNNIVNLVVKTCSFVFTKHV